MFLEFRDDAIATVLPSRDQFPNFTQPLFSLPIAC